MSMLEKAQESAAKGTKPAFAGLSGSKLGFAISFISTTGFLLFGYDQGKPWHSIALSD